MNIPEGKDYAIRNQSREEKEKKDNQELIPDYHMELNLSEDEIEKFTEQVQLEFNALKDERKELKLEEAWEERDRQYDGELKTNKTLAFNLHVHQSKIKTDAITRALNEAFLDSEPMFDISPRPETARRNGFAIAEKQTQFLDFVVDEEMKPEAAFMKIAKSATTKFVGIGKLCWAYKREKRRREETYEGKIVPLGVQNGQIIAKNEGLERFLTTYPDALDNQKGIIKRLMEEKTVNLVIEYKDTIDNNAELKYIQLKNFYVKNSCEYQKGLRDTHLVAERQCYTYWELEKKQADGEFKDVDRLYTESESKDDTSKSYMTKDYDVIEATTYYAFKDGEEEIKVKAWFGEKDDKLIYLGGEVYPYYGFDTDYLAFYLKLNDEGFFGGAKSVMYDLRDSNIAQDALLNLVLHGNYIRNTLTPIVKEGSEMEAMFLDHQFQAGKPLVVDELTDDVSKAMSFVRWDSMDINGSMLLMEKMKRIDSDVSRVSDLTSGQESALDPTAPAAKTIALLEQSGIGIKDYIRTFLPTFNVLATNVLQLYYQMSNEDKMYRIAGKSKAVTGENPFEMISREEMVVKTNVESRAAAFVFDKINEKREALAAYQTVLNDPYAAQQPNLKYKALKVLLETFGARWKTIVDTDLLSPEEFMQQQMQVAVKALQALMAQAQQQGQVTGVQPNMDEVLGQAPQAITQAQAVSYDPRLAEEEK